MSCGHFPLVLLYLSSCRPSYGHFAKNGPVSLSPAVSGQPNCGQFCDPIWASNLVWFLEFLGSVVLTKIVAPYLSFPMVLNSGYLDKYRGSYDQMNMYCSFGHFLGFVQGHPDLGSI